MCANMCISPVCVLVQCAHACIFIASRMQTWNMRRLVALFRLFEFESKLCQIRVGAHLICNLLRGHAALQSQVEGQAGHCRGLDDVGHGRLVDGAEDVVLEIQTGVIGHMLGDVQNTCSTATLAW